MAPARTRTSSAWRARLLACAGLAAWAGVGLGCATAPATARPPESARITIVNLTDHAWRVRFVPEASPGGASITQIAGRATHAIALPPGGYAIEQAISGADEEGPGRREIRATFVAGENYEWSLATVHAIGAVGSGARSEARP